MRHAPLTILLLSLSLFAMSPAQADQGAQTTLHLLDYVGADYGGAVADGKVKSADEFKEMQEFVEQAEDRLRHLPDNPAKAGLVADAGRLSALVAAKAAPAQVADVAAKLRLAVAAAYGLALAPRHAPDATGGATLYAANCASCHGVSGRGDGPAGKGLAPVPANFHATARMATRSLYGLYNTITLGVAGTSMTAHPRLSDDERWALAFYVAGLGADPARVREGEELWTAGRARDTFRDLASVTSLSAEEMRARHGDQAVPIQAFLVSHPAALTIAKPAPIAFARESLATALQAYRRGDRSAAREHATVAYLEGYELVEAALDNVDKPLRLSIEREMLELRSAISRGIPADALAAQVADLDKRLALASGRLEAGSLSPGGAYASALVILLREGLEAILLLAAIIAFVKRTGRKETLKYVHAGWVLALALGFATWAIASYVIGISGENRELTEGITALFAAAMLLYVGYWLHGKSQAQAWSTFLRDSVGQALEKKTLWAMVGVSFLAVYREIFEVVLFYEALWVQAGPPGQAAIWGGIGTAALLLAGTGWGIFKYSVRLPLGPFFSAMSILLALMAVVFTGQGVAALQGAGVIGATHVQFFTLHILGIHPTIESLGAQLLAAALVIVGMRAGDRAQAPAPASEAKS